jgi:hypothetical protein
MVPDSPTNNTSNSNSNGNSIGQATIFIHTVFACATLALFAFLERAILMVRAARHRHSFSTPDDGRLSGHFHQWAWAPWHRPDLPSYAVALGFRGTGDVEDAIIAAHAGAPPPEYGSTRGGVLLLSSLHTNANNGAGAGGQAVPQSRPASYTFRWDGIPYVTEGVPSSSGRGSSRHGQRLGTRDDDEDGDGDGDNDHGLANDGHRALLLKELSQH